MRPHLLSRPNPLASSLSVRHDIVPHFLNQLHYHEEIELVYVIKGSGTRFIGDSITPFNEGDILLIGPNLPHYLRCDEHYFKNTSGLFAEAIGIFFREDFWGATFLNLPENRGVKELLKKSKKGILITGETRAKMEGAFYKILKAKNTKKIILLLDVLHTVSLSKDVQFLSSSVFEQIGDAHATSRINDVYQYTMDHFKNKITLDEVAAVAHLSTNHFCRYFKLHTRKTYFEFLTEIRIGNACKLLVQKKFSINNICYESGFSNSSHFNRCFRHITGKTPFQYKKEYMKEFE